MSSATPNTGERANLEKSLSPWQVWALALGSIVGWGCFVLPGIRFLPEAGPLATIIAFGIGGGLLCFVALAYGHMIKHCPVAGGEFAYAYVGFGPTAAFICGWALALGYLSIVAINASALALLTRFMLPGVLEFGHLYTIAGWDVYTGELLMMSGAICFFGIMNYRGVDFAGSLQVVLAFALCTGAVVLAYGTYSAPTFAWDNLNPLFAENKSAFSSILSIVAISPFLFVGFDTIPQAAEEFDFPADKAKKLMLYAIGFGALLYAMLTFSVAGIIPYPELLAQDLPWITGTTANMAFGTAGSVVLSIAVVGGICTGMNGFYLATTRLLLSMARGGFLPKAFGEVHPRYHTPHKSVLFTMLFCLIAPWGGRSVLGWIVDMSAVGTAIAYIFTCLTAYKLLKANPNYEGATSGRIIALIGSVASILILALLVIPGSPAAIEHEPWIMMVVWGVMGVAFYLKKMPNVRATSPSHIRYMVLGNVDAQVLFDEEEKFGVSEETA